MSNEFLVTELHKVLADMFMLYLKALNYHWNIEGPQFVSLHSLFESHYTDLAEALDTTAELIRGLGHKVDATVENYQKLSVIGSGDQTLSESSMIDDLIQGYQVMTETTEKALKSAQKEGDEVLINFFAERLTVYRKSIWMLKSCLVC